MKNHYWLPPLLMIAGSLCCSLLFPLLPRSSRLLPTAVTALLFILTGLLLRRTCSQKVVLISVAGLMIFSLAVMGLDLLVPFFPGARQLGMILEYLRLYLFFPFQQTLPPADTLFLHYFLPSLFPFLWVLFCKPSP